MIRQRQFQTTTTTRLIDISADSIAEIFEYVNLQHLNALYECGNRALQQLMLRGGVQSISSISFKQPPLTILRSRYPCVRELYITSYIKVARWCRLLIPLSDVPDNIFPQPTPETTLIHLRTLHINPTNIGHANPTLSEILCLPQSLTNLMLRGVSISDDIVMFPRHLITLSLPDDVRLTDAGVACLPPSLKHLSLRRNSNLTAHGIMSLPAGLISLCIPQSTRLNDCDIIHLSNSSLQTLDLGSCRKLTQKCIVFLPQNLTKLKLPKHAAYSPQSIAQLPPALTSLNIGNISSSSSDIRVVSWRTGLKKLCIGHWCNYIDDGSDSDSDENNDFDITNNNFTFTNDDIWWLPRTLTHLDIKCLNDIDNAGILFLPPHLLRLRVKYDCQINDACIANLPRGLLELNLRKNLLLTDRSFAHLPPNLLILKLPDNIGIVESGLRRLPATLMELNLKSASHRFSTEAFKLLPRHLVKLNFGLMQRVVVDSKSAESLPPCLTSLDVGICFGNICAPNLPRSLTRFRLGRFLGFGLLPSRSSVVPLGLKWMEVPLLPQKRDRSDDVLDFLKSVLKVAILTLFFTFGLLGLIYFQQGHLRSWE